MTAPIGGYHRLLFPTDLATDTEGAYAHAFRLALAGAGELHVVHVHVPDATPDWSHLPSARDLCVRWQRLDERDGVDAYERLGVSVLYTGLASLEMRTPIQRAAEHDHSDLLVLGTAARKGTDRLRMPSVAEELARRVSLPTLFVPVDARPFVSPSTGSVSLRTVIVAAGTGSLARRGLLEAVRLVRSYEAAPCTFILVHVGDREDAPVVRLPGEDEPWTVRMDHREGDILRQLLAAADAHEADAIVMATEGHDSIPDWVRGSTTELVVRHARCPVLAVPAVSGLLA